MDYSATFARHFSRLVSLLMHEPGSVDEQKVSLRALVTVSRNGPVMLSVVEATLVANDHPIAAALTGVRDVASQMTAHSILRIAFGAAVAAPDLLGTARIIAADAQPGDGGASARERLQALGATTIEFITPTPDPVPQAEIVPESKPAPVSSEAPTVVVPVEKQEQESRAAQDAEALVKRIVATDYSKVTSEEFFKALDGSSAVDQATKALDDLANLAEHNARIGKSTAVGDVMWGLVQREAALGEGELKRAYGLAIRRLSKPATLRAVAGLIPKKPERRQYYFEVLARTGDEGAEALIEQINQAQTSEDRKRLFEVLTELPEAVPALIRMLGDSRWFVVRNAADLLGEIGAARAEEALVALLRHSDDRVRRAATNALVRVGTPNALKGIYEAVSDTSPEVRMQAAAAVSTRKDGRASATLIRAIEDEGDADVQLAMIAALGRVATPDAIQKLVKMAEPEGRLFRKKSTNIRVAAVQALGDAKTPGAIAALKELTGDKEKDVRETASRALAHSSR
jgi:HEAT repeat protein